MIKCPKCAVNNNLQKFCGSCGNPLLTDEVEIQETGVDSITLTTGGVKESWITMVLSFVLRIIIFIILFCVGMKLLFMGAFNLMSAYTDFIKIRKRYFFILSFAILFFM